jgi:hypothetical protein
MGMSFLLTTAAFAASLVASTAAMATNFSGIPEMPEQQQQQQAQYPADPPIHQQIPYQQQLRNQQTGPYDSPDFVVPPYEIN